MIKIYAYYKNNDTVFEAIPDEGTAPDGVVFGQPFDTNALHLSSLDPMHAVGFWLKRVVNAEADTNSSNRNAYMSTANTNQKSITFSKILVAIDGSDESMNAADYAIFISKEYNAELYALH